MHSVVVDGCLVVATASILAVAAASWSVDSRSADSSDATAFGSILAASAAASLAALELVLARHARNAVELQLRRLLRSCALGAGLIVGLGSDLARAPPCREALSPNGSDSWRELVSFFRNS